MVSLLPSSPSAGPGAPPASTGHDPTGRHTRPVALVSVGGGLVAALTTLAGCLTAGMVGWFLSDSGAHGAPRDGLKVGALGWLMAHRSGVHVDGVPITLVPLLLTLLCAITVWKVAHRVGDAVSGRGPDADRLADGERDWTVPGATLGFTAGYAAVVAATAALLGDAAAAPSTFRALTWVLALALVLVLPAVAAGSGRAAVWTAPLPDVVTRGFLTTLSVVRAFLVVSLLLVVAATLGNAGTAVNVVSQLQLDPAGVVAYALVTVLLVPNAVLFGGAYLLGPGFAVGAGTLVAPTGVVLGALPLFPLLAALPGNGPVPAWAPWLIALPSLVAAVATTRTQRRHPTVRWDEGVVRGLGGGVAAGVVVGLLTALAGGSAGPGRMQVVAPFAFDVMLHAITMFGLGGLVGGAAMTWWQRRSLREAAEPAGATSS